MASTTSRIHTAPLGNAKTARLAFTRGVAPHVTATAGARPGELFQATFDGPAPDVRVQQGESAVVSLEYGGFLRWLMEGGPRPGPASIALNASVPWSVEIRGGVAKSRFDLSSLDVREFSLTGGMSDVELTLPAAKGETEIRIRGGVSNVRIRRPRGTPASLELSGGASDITLDAQHLGAVGGQLRLESPGFASAQGRYVVRVAGGASRLDVREA